MPVSIAVSGNGVRVYVNDTSALVLTTSDARDLLALLLEAVGDGQ